MLPMQTDPILEWQKLREHYRELGDDELRELAADFNDLTPTAQQALRNEMQSRRLGDREVASNAPVPSNAPTATPIAATALRTKFESRAPAHEVPASAFSYWGRSPEIVPDAPESRAEDNGSVEYTWKTLLCECETMQEARELSGALKQAGIESWIEDAATGSRYAGLGLWNPRVLVAADQLDQARAIAARPVPPEIVEESETKATDYEPPKCPRCGAKDPVLDGVDPVNSWRCEQCGQQWTDPAATGDEGEPKTANLPF
jgi:ribosomal protein L37AE/L43A